MGNNINEIKVDKLEDFSSLDFDAPPTYDIYDSKVAQEEYKRFLENELKGEDKNADDERKSGTI